MLVLALLLLDILLVLALLAWVFFFSATKIEDVDGTFWAVDAKRWSLVFKKKRKVKNDK